MGETHAPDFAKAREGGRVIVRDCIKAIEQVTRGRVHLPDVANLHNMMDGLFDEAFRAGQAAALSRPAVETRGFALSDAVASLRKTRQAILDGSVDLRQVANRIGDALQSLSTVTPPAPDAGPRMNADGSCARCGDVGCPNCMERPKVAPAPDAGPEARARLYAGVGATTWDAMMAAGAAALDDLEDALEMDNATRAAAVLDAAEEVRAASPGAEREQDVPPRPDGGRGNEGFVAGMMDDPPEGPPRSARALATYLDRLTTGGMLPPDGARVDLVFETEVQGMDLQETNITFGELRRALYLASTPEPASGGSGE